MTLHQTLTSAMKKNKAGEGSGRSGLVLRGTEGWILF